MNIENFIPRATDMKQISEDSEVMRVANLIREYAEGGYSDIDLAIDEPMIKLLKEKGYKLRSNTHLKGRTKVSWG